MTIVMKMMMMAVVLMVMVNRAMHFLACSSPTPIVIRFAKFMIITSSL